MIARPHLLGTTALLLMAQCYLPVVLFAQWNGSYAQPSLGPRPTMTPPLQHRPLAFQHPLPEQRRQYQALPNYSPATTGNQRAPLYNQNRLHSGVTDGYNRQHHSGAPSLQRWQYGVTAHNAIPYQQPTPRTTPIHAPAQQMAPTRAPALPTGVTPKRAPRLPKGETGDDSQRTALLVNAIVRTLPADNSAVESSIVELSPPEVDSNSGAEEQTNTSTSAKVETHTAQSYHFIQAPSLLSAQRVAAQESAPGAEPPRPATAGQRLPAQRSKSAKPSIAELALPPEFLSATQGKSDQSAAAPGKTYELLPAPPESNLPSTRAPAPSTPGEREAESPRNDKWSQLDPLDAIPSELLGPARPQSSAADMSPPPNSQRLPGNSPQTRADPHRAAEPAPYLRSDGRFDGKHDIAGQHSDTGDSPTDGAAPKKNKLIKDPEHPIFFESVSTIAGPHADTLTTQVPYDGSVFSPGPLSVRPTNPTDESAVYRGKRPVPIQRPLVELGRPLYTSGIYPPAKNWLGRYNPVMPHFMVYGDFRTGVGINRNVNGDANVWASRLNLDMDLEITATERIHAFMGPLDRNGDFTRFDFTDSFAFVDRTDLRFDTLFFEGDVGSIWGGIADHDSTFDLPFSFGFLPLFYQNGIWAADAVLGAAVALPAKHNRLLNWSNYDATFFWASDQINSDAFAGDLNAAEFFGTAWFIEAYDGYIEADYAFVHDDVGGHRSYHNLSFAFTRRYFQRISNAVRFITNVGQSLPSDQRTADGHLILIENSLISAAPNTFVPYLNFFYGQGITQSLARAGGAGGILNNTGINFETDGLTGYPTLDATGVNTSGFALGVNMLGDNFEQQLILELAALNAHGSSQFRNAPGDQYAFGVRYQRPISNALLIRTDGMFGVLRGADDIRGSRIELRWKF